MAPDGKHVYAFGPNTSEVILNISVINTANDEVVATIPLDGTLADTVAFQNPTTLAMTPDGRHLYVTTEFCPFPGFACHPEAAYFAVWSIDTATNNAALITTGKGIANGIAFSLDGQLTYLTEYDPYYGTPQVMVVENGNLILFPGHSTPEAIAITPDGKHLYVPYLSNGDTFFVAVVDSGTNTIIQSILLGPGPNDPPFANQLAVTPDGKYVYVPTGNNDVAVIETASNTIVKTVVVGSSATGIDRNARRSTSLRGKSSEQQRIGDQDGQQYSDEYGAGCRTNYVSIIPPPQGVRSSPSMRGSTSILTANRRRTLLILFPLSS